MSLTTKLSWGDPRVWGGKPPGAIPPTAPLTPEERARNQDFYAATVGKTRPPEGSIKLGEDGGWGYWKHSIWGYMRENGPRKRAYRVGPRGGPGIPYRIEQIPREKVPPALVGLTPIHETPISTTVFPWGYVLLVALAFLTLGRRS